MNEPANGAITVEQGLTEIINVLNSINVPVLLLEQIGVPIQNCANNLKLCLEALRKGNEPKEEEDIIDLGEVLEDGEEDETEE